MCSQILHDDGFAIFMYFLVKTLFNEILINERDFLVHMYLHLCVAKHGCNAVGRLMNLTNISCSEASAGFVARLPSNVQGKS